MSEVTLKATRASLIQTVDAEPGKYSQAELGHILGVSRARVQQLVKRLDLGHLVRPRPGSCYCLDCGKPIRSDRIRCLPCWRKINVAAMVTLSCDACGKQFERKASATKRSKLHFCSTSCRDRRHLLVSKQNRRQDEIRRLGKSVCKPVAAPPEFKKPLPECPMPEVAKGKAQLKATSIMGEPVTIIQITQFYDGPAKVVFIRGDGTVSEAGLDYIVYIHEEPMVTSLTQRQMQILRYVAQGRNDKEIAEALGISTHTIKNHMTSIFLKLNAKTRAHAVAIFMAGGDFGARVEMPREGLKIAERVS